VWRTSAGLRKRGSHLEPYDLCIAITDESRGPCGRRALSHLGDWVDEDGDWYPGQPFCESHLAEVLEGAKAHLLLDAESKAEIRAKEQLEVAKAKRRLTNKGRKEYVYFAFRHDRLKIGHTIQPRQRIRTLETQMGAEFNKVIFVEGKRSKEALLHRKFAEHRLIGEWFKPHPDILDYVAKLNPAAPY